MTSAAAGGRKVSPKTHASTGRPGRKIPPPPPPPTQHRTGSPSTTRSTRGTPRLNTSTPAVTRNTVSPRAMTFFGVGILAFSTYCGYLYTSYRQEVISSRSLTVPEDVSDRYKQTARGYDAEVDLGEKAMRLGKRRQELVRMARGDVLEVSCGTGRNMQYYQLGEKRGTDRQGRSEVQGCRSVTFVDLSEEMVGIARDKFRKRFPDWTMVAFRVQDAREVVPSPNTGAVVKATKPSEGKESWTMPRSYFDTVLQTMGLCSTPDPAGLLRHLGAVTEPQNGRILLLEHGRSHYAWLNNILDNLASAHANRHGCWWNRDIGKIVEQSGLEVVEIQRYHLGTTWRVILRPRPKPKDSQELAKESD